VSRIDDLIAQHCPNGVERKTLAEVGEFVRGGGLQKKDFVEDGYPCIHYGQIYTFYGTSTTTTKSFISPELAATLKKAEPGDLVVTTTSENIEDVCTAVAWLGDGPIAIGGHSCVFKHTLDPMYATYFFQTDQFELQKRRFVTGTKVKDIKTADIGRIQIPVPPLAIQREIASILDKMESLKAELEAELEYRSRQYAFYRRQLLTFSRGTDIRWSTLGDVCDSAFSGGTPLATRSAYYGGSIPWLRTQEVDYGVIHQTTVHITEAGLANSSAKWVRPDSVIVAISGAGVTRGRAAINKIALTTNQHCCNLEIDKSQARHRFVYYWLVHNYDDLRSRGQGNRSDLNVGLIKNYPIALPPLDEQERIVAILDKFDALVNDLSVGLPAEIAARRKQYEYYRDKLLTFEEAA
jgi:type I restriction enzyme S subunit